MRPAGPVGAEQGPGGCDDLLQGDGQATFKVQVVQFADAGGQRSRVDLH
jgi:hypothetical protein